MYNYIKLTKLLTLLLQLRFWVIILFHEIHFSLKILALKYTLTTVVNYSAMFVV